ncbi:MAG: hypothetical protein HYX41_07130 [Bdellovibrio sp.]|nr:hypothetical protein [Bdellovibrio sp.]
MNKSPGFLDIDTFALIVFGIVTTLFCVTHLHAGEVRTIKLNQTTVGTIYVTPGRSTVLSFPTKPAKVVLGNQGVFAIEYVESDLAIAALSAASHSDLFVYLDGRRFAFNLVTVSKGGDTIVLVRDAVEGPPVMVFQRKTPKLRSGVPRKAFHE